MDCKFCQIIFVFMALAARSKCITHGMWVPGNKLLIICHFRCARKPATMLTSDAAACERLQGATVGGVIL
jgi:hypothetical protein